MSEYGYSTRQALYGIPVTAIFALLPAQRARKGDDSQPTLGERAALTARANCREYLETHYHIE